MGLFFKAPVCSKHWVNKNRSVFMKGDPVVWKNRIGSIRFRSIIKNGKANMIFFKQVYQSIEFFQRFLLNISTGICLEAVIYGRFGIESEIDRPNHQKVAALLHSNMLMWLSVVHFAGRNGNWQVVFPGRNRAVIPGCISTIGIVSFIKINK